MPLSKAPNAADALFENRRIPRQVEIDAHVGGVLEVESDPAGIGGEENRDGGVVVEGDNAGFALFRRFLTGEPGSRALWNAVVQRIEQLPEVASVRFVRIEFVGPKQILLVASVDLVGDSVESSIARTLRRLESELETNKAVVDAVLTVADPDEEGIGNITAAG